MEKIRFNVFPLCVVFLLFLFLWYISFTGSKTITHKIKKKKKKKKWKKCPENCGRLLFTFLWLFYNPFFHINILKTCKLEQRSLRKQQKISDQTNAFFYQFRKICYDYVCVWCMRLFLYHSAKPQYDMKRNVTRSQMKCVTKIELSSTERWLAPSKKSEKYISSWLSY